MSISLLVNGAEVVVEDESLSLLTVLREQLGLRSVKDGCSPQGQCGCCTVLINGTARVACVTPVRRVAGRSIVTLEGLESDRRAQWSEAFCETGASQCGFCTPGIILRLESLLARDPATAAAAVVTADAPGSDSIALDPVAIDLAAVDRSLAAHLCRCTGWLSIHDAFDLVADAEAGRGLPAERNLEAASRRATLEGGAPQTVGPEIALGLGGFADDGAPPDALVAVLDEAGDWVVGESMAEARMTAGKVQGRRTTVESTPPLTVPDGEWDLTLATSWVEPAYLETDASWCEPGGEPFTPLANGGAFGAKTDSPVGAVARRLADEHGRTVRVVLSREDAVRLGAKRPPIAAGLRSDGTGIMRVVSTPGIVDAIAGAAPDLVVEEIDAAGPETSTHLRGAGWVEAAVLRAALDARRRTVDGSGPDATTVLAPNGAKATVVIDDDGGIRIEVACGDPLDEVVLRSYCLGAAHMALSWVTSEGLAVDEDGVIGDLTIRSFGILRAADMPTVEINVDSADTGEPINGSDAVFAAVAAAVWIRQGCPPAWPTRLPWPPRGATPGA